MRALTGGLIAVFLSCLHAPHAGGAEVCRPAPPGTPAPVAQALDGVVGLRVREVVAVPVFRGGRFRREPVEGTGAGSGVVVSRQGLILTNAHVVDGGPDVLVRLSSGPTLRGQVIAIDHASDLALVRVPGADLRPISMPAAAPAEPGQPVYVVGNRNDAGMEILTGRIGIRLRVRAGVRPLEFWTELDAPVGPGDSGGAVLDAAGRLIGMTTLRTVYSTEAEGLMPRPAGLFIPARHLRRAVSRMIGGSAPRWAWIGLVLDDPLLAAVDGRSWDVRLEPRVRSVLRGSPARQAGFRPGDRILAIDRRPVGDNAAALEAILDLAPGTAVDVTIDREGRRMIIPVTSSVRPDDPRPEALDDFALHTGLRLHVPDGRGQAPQGLAFAGMMPGLQARMPRFEVEMLAGAPALRSLLPGRDLLAGGKRGRLLRSLDDLADLLPGCFVGEQFVALIHWGDDSRSGADRAYVHRKLYPVVL